MNIYFTEKQMRTMRRMMGVGTVSMVLALIARVLLFPLLRDSDTGRFVTGWAVVALMIIALIVLAVMAFDLREKPPLIGKTGSNVLASVTVIAGVALLLSSLWDGWQLMANRQQPPPVTAGNSLVGGISLILTIFFGLLGGFSLIYWGLKIVSERVTRSGLQSLGMLTPVMWMWFRLARYEMSYASAVGLSETFYDFMMFIFMLLFLYKMARYVVGVGVPTMGSLLFFSLGTMLFALSGTLTRLCMYLAGDGEAYRASQLAGWPDFALGVLALVFAGALVAMAEPVQEVDDSEEGDAPAANTVLVFDEEEDLSQE